MQIWRTWQFMTKMNYKQAMILFAIFMQVFSLENHKPTICLHSNQAGVRGTEIALYDYADFLDREGYKVIIMFPFNVYEKRDKDPASSSLSKFQARFLNKNVVTYKPTYNRLLGGPNMGNLVAHHQCDMVYMIKHGEVSSDPRLDTFAKLPKVCIANHAVFKWEQHGDAYASISPVVANPKGKTAVVPHMIVPPNQILELINTSVVSFRKQLNIPEEAVTFCRLGGSNTFDVKAAQEAVINAVKKFNTSRLHFVFMGTDKFLTAYKYAKQIHFLRASSDVIEKERFFDTCDVMIHGRMEGESFGIAVGEFSVRNMPVMTYGITPSNGRNHIQLLGKVGYIYNNSKEALNIISNFVLNGVPNKGSDIYNVFKEYSPEAVMQLFHTQFIQPCIQKGKFPSTMVTAVTRNSSGVIAL